LGKFGPWGGVAGCFWLDGGTPAQRHRLRSGTNGGRRTGKSAGAT